MTVPLLTTKLHVPPVRPRARVVPRPRLIERLNEGHRLGRKLTLISAPAGFGKTTLVSEWIHHGCCAATAPLQVAWLSLDDGDTDLVRFLAYFIAALQTTEAGQEHAGKIATGAPSALVKQNLRSLWLPHENYSGGCLISMGLRPAFRAADGMVRKLVQIWSMIWNSLHSLVNSWVV